MDGVSGLVQELADVADALVDCLGPDAEQGGDGDLGQGEALVEDGGQEPVGEGEDGAAAGSGGSHPGAVTAACVQVRFALLVVECQQRGDQGVPVAGGQPGDGRAGEPDQIGTGQAEGVGSAAGLVVFLGVEAVVPVAVPVAAGQR